MSLCSHPLPSPTQAHVHAYYDCPGPGRHRHTSECDKAWGLFPLPVLKLHPLYLEPTPFAYPTTSVTLSLLSLCGADNNSKRAHSLVL